MRTAAHQEMALISGIPTYMCFYKVYVSCRGETGLPFKQSFAAVSQKSLGRQEKLRAHHYFTGLVTCHTTLAPYLIHYVWDQGLMELRVTLRIGLQSSSVAGKFLSPNLRAICQYVPPFGGTFPT